MRTRAATLILSGVLMAVIVPFLLRAPAYAQSKSQEGAVVYRSRCVHCHGAKGAGRRAMKGSNLLTREMKNLSDEELRVGIASGGKTRNPAHAFADKGVSTDQIAALVEYIRALQGHKYARRSERPGNLTRQ